MRSSLTRPRVLIGAGLLLFVAGLLAGIFFPPNRAGAGAAAPETGEPPLLVVKEYADTESTLWLVDASDPARRTLWARVPHAFGWDLEGAVSPDGTRLAYLVAPPSAVDPATDAVLLLRDRGSEQTLAKGLDLSGRLAWTADGAVLVRQAVPGADGRTTYRLLEVNTDGAARTLLDGGTAAGLYPVGGGPDGARYAVTMGAQGSTLWIIGPDGQPAALPLADSVTRDWALSPDGRQLAFTAQQGVRLRVAVATLPDGAGTLTTAAQAPPPRPALRDGSAAPAWHPDGSLSVGTFGAEANATLRLHGEAAPRVDYTPAQGFTLPVAWSADGAYLAVRAFSGTGPGSVGQEAAAVIGPDGALQVIPGQYARVLGWWDARG